MLSVSGCRGIVGASLTPEVAARFAGTFGAFAAAAAAARACGKPRIALGRDGRVGGTVIQHAAISGLLASGCDVVDLGIAATPTVAVMADELAWERRGGLAVGMVLTASHNPQQWNGLKCLYGLRADEFGSAACAPEAALAGEVIERFKAHAPYTLHWEGSGTLSEDDSADFFHVERVVRALEDAGITDDPDGIGAGLAICIDSVNSSGINGARLLMERLGIDELCHLGNQPSGIFPHPPEPTADNLAVPGGLCDAVRQTKSHVGFAQDPDADRLALIDEQGRYIGEEYTLVLAAQAVLEARRAVGQPTQGLALAANLSTSRMLDDLAARFGARVVRTAVGEANVVAGMKPAGAIIGGEGNGGVIWPRVTYVRDSLSSMALVLALMKSTGKPLSTLVSDIPAYAIVKRKVDLDAPGAAHAAADKVAAAFAAHRIDRQDGVRVDLDAERAWLHVRGSNTEPIMRLIAEAPTAAMANRLLAEAERAIAR